MAPRLATRRAFLAEKYRMYGIAHRVGAVPSLITFHTLDPKSKREPPGCPRGGSSCFNGQLAVRVLRDRPRRGTQKYRRHPIQIAQMIWDSKLTVSLWDARKLARHLLHNGFLTLPVTLASPEFSSTM